MFYHSDKNPTKTVSKDKKNRRNTNMYTYFIVEGFFSNEINWYSEKKRDLICVGVCVRLRYRTSTEAEQQASCKTRVR